MENEVTNINNQMNENNQKGKLEEKNSNGGYIKQILTGIGAAIALGVGGKIAYDKSKEDKEDDKKSDKEDNDKESDKEDDDKEREKEKDKKDNKEEDSTLRYQGIDDKDSFILKLKKKLSIKPKVICDEIDNNNYIWVNSETTKDDDKERVESFICPISKKIMEDPVITPYGTTYEKSAILNWIKKNKTDYINNKVLTEDMLVTDYVLKTAIKEYNKSIKL